METLPKYSFENIFQVYEKSQNSITGKLKKDATEVPQLDKTVWFQDLEYSGHCFYDATSDDVFVIVNTNEKRDADKYMCVGDSTKSTKIECESARVGGVWDKQCTLNTDCPFYNRVQKPYRGGCDSGYCEMPIGIKPLGFTRYNISSAPYCRGCEPMMMQTPEECCNNSANPIYAFPGDILERFSQPECETLDELPDDEFQALFDAAPLPLEDKMFLKPIDTALIETTHVEESCTALLKHYNLSRLKYKFGKVIDARVYEWAHVDTSRPTSTSTTGGFVFTANVCIHQPEKTSGKLIEYECRRTSAGVYTFIYVRVMHAVGQDRIAFYS
jgi:hypothetical protein